MSIIKKLINELLGTNKPKQQAEQPQQHPQPQAEKECENAIVKKRHRVAGVSHYTENLLLLAKENPDYSLRKNEIIKRNKCDECIYQHKFSYSNIELIPEPTNQYDPNAIKVIIDGQHIGYIKAGSCKHILNLINEKRIERIEAKIKGGKYKCLCQHGDDPKEDSEMEYGKDSYSIDLFFYERNK